MSPAFTVNGTAVTVSSGATIGNSSTITVTPAGGFTGKVALTAAVTSSPSSAQHLPAFTDPTAATATLTITTTAATSAALIHPKVRGVPWYSAGGATLVCVVLFVIPARRRKWRTMLGMAVLLVTLAGAALACGGLGSGGGVGTSSPGTTATGTVTLTVK